MCRRGVDSGREAYGAEGSKPVRLGDQKGDGGRPDSIGRMPIGVDEKQLVAHLSTLCQKVLSLEREPAMGVTRYAP